MLEFDKYQLKEIEKGKEAGLDVSKYAKPEFDAEKMWCIRNLMERNIDFTPILDKSGTELTRLYKQLKNNAK